MQTPPPPIYITYQNNSASEIFNTYQNKILTNTLTHTVDNINLLLTTLNSDSMGSFLLSNAKMVNSYLETIYDQLMTLSEAGVLKQDDTGSLLFFYQIKIQQFCNGKFNQDPLSPDRLNPPIYNSGTVSGYSILLPSDLYSLNKTPIDEDRTTISIINGVSDILKQIKGLLAFSNLIIDNKN